MHSNTQLMNKIYCRVIVKSVESWIGPCFGCDCVRLKHIVMCFMCVWRCVRIVMYDVCVRLDWRCNKRDNDILYSMDVYGLSVLTMTRVSGINIYKYNRWVCPVLLSYICTNRSLLLWPKVKITSATQMMCIGVNLWLNNRNSNRMDL